MKKTIIKLFTLVLLFSFIATPAIAQVMSAGAQSSDPPEFTTPNRPEPELLPQEILDEFEGGMTIEEFLIRNQGPIPNALLDYANIPLAVVVQLDKPSLIEFVNQGGVDRSSERGQIDYVSQLESDQAAVMGQIMAARGAEVTQIGAAFTKTLNGFMLRVPANAINEIRAIPGVKSVTRAPEHELTLGASVPLIGADDVWNDFGFTGEGITIAVIDTGIDYTHAMLGGSGVPADYAGNDPDIVEPGTFPTAKVIGGYDFAGSDYNAGDPANNIPVPDPDPLDEHGHGTHVASTAAGLDIGFGPGVAPDAKLYALKVFGRSGSTNLTLHAIEWAMDPNGLGHLAEPVDVINMSLGSNWGPADETNPQYQAVENATSIGVVVVASAGNAGNSSYIVGSPSTSDSAISVAASTTGYQTAPYIEYEHGGTKYMPYTTSYNPFTTTITADLIDVAGFDLSTVPGELCDITGVATDALAGDIALIKRGTCPFSDKVNNAEALGAVAAIIYNNAAGIISMDTTGSTLPAGSILQSDGIVLKGLAPIEISVGPDSNVTTFISADPPDTIATFSSRGPRGFDSKLKPEITAPGVSIFAADMGTGNLGVGSSGTSMAAPHIAGVAALMAEAHPGWDPVHIKAAMMNTAVDLVGGPIIPRHGAGRVDAYDAVTTSVVAYADPKLVSLSWGLIEVFDTYTDTQTLTIKNFGAAPVSLDIDTLFISSKAGATLTPAVTTVTVPAFGVASVDVTLELDATLLPINFVRTHEEYYGFVTFEGTTELLRVPFYFVPRPYTEITELDAENQFEVNDLGLVLLQQSGPKPSNLWYYPVSLVSPQNPSVLDAADLRYIGMDYGWFQPGYGDIFVPAFAMWGGVHTNQPFFNEVDLYIDTPYGSVVNFNYNYAWVTGAGQNNQWIVIQVDFADGLVYLGSPFLIYADYNSGFQEWYLPAVWQYVLDEFEYEVVSFDWNGASDYGGMSRFDISRPPMSFGLTSYTPQNQAFMFGFWLNDWWAYNNAEIQGVMLVDYHGQPGAGQAYYWPIEPFFNTFYPVFGR
jgi:subtilisin family serine protease